VATSPKHTARGARRKSIPAGCSSRGRNTHEQTTVAQLVQRFVEDLAALSASGDTLAPLANLSEADFNTLVAQLRSARTQEAAGPSPEANGQ
jgi:hypothetical protein